MFKQLKVITDTGVFKTIGIYLECIEIVEEDTDRTCFIICNIIDERVVYNIFMSAEKMIALISLNQFTASVEN